MTPPQEKATLLQVKLQSFRPRRPPPVGLPQLLAGFNDGSFTNPTFLQLITRILGERVRYGTSSLVIDGVGRPRSERYRR